MARKKRSSEDTSTETPKEETVETSAEVPKEPEPAPAPAPKPTPKPKAPPKKAEPVMTFDRWFAHQGKPAHHKAGMLAFLKKKGGRPNSKRTVAAWDALFATY
jgi:hypothetical protein